MLAMAEPPGQEARQAVRRSLGMAGFRRGKESNMRKAHKKVVGELTIDTTFAQTSHQPVLQCKKIGVAPSPGAWPGASVVNSWILLGARDDLESEEQLRRLGVTSVLSVRSECEAAPLPPLGFPCCVVAVNDSSDAKIEKHFKKAFEFIDSTHRAQGRVLVQCRKGISRSATLVIAYLMKHHNWGFEQSFDFVKGKRGVINPNLGFVLALEKFGKRMNNSNNINNSSNNNHTNANEYTSSASLAPPIPVTPPSLAGNPPS